MRAVPTQAFNLAFKDTIKAMFPKVDKKQDALKSFAINMASGGLAGAGSLMIVYPLDYARTRLASDVGTGKAQFKGLADCLVKTASGPGGVLSLYNGFGVSVIGIIPYRGVYFGFFDTLMVSATGLGTTGTFQVSCGLTGLSGGIQHCQWQPAVAIGLQLQCREGCMGG